ncbi:hypothetical protein GCM10009548_73220 [Streptomyces malaysiensis subsp. malaysiensis]
MARTKYTVNRADSNRRRFSFRPSSPTTRSTISGGQDWVKIPSPNRPSLDISTPAQPAGPHKSNGIAMRSTGGESHTDSSGRAPHCGATKKVMG